MPCKLIQAGSKTVGELSGQHRNERRHRFNIKPQDMPEFFWIILFRDIVHAFINESLMLDLYGLEMKFSSCRFHSKEG